MKISLGYKFWLYYCTILAVLLLVGGFYISNSSKNLLIANVLFIPVVLLFLLAVLKFRKEDEAKVPHASIAGTKIGLILLVFSLLLCTIISAGGFIIARSNAEIISNVVFLPITIFCWYVYYKRPKTSKGIVGKTTDAILKGVVNVAQKRGIENNNDNNNVQAENTRLFDSEKMQNGSRNIEDLAARQAVKK